MSSVTEKKAKAKAAEPATESPEQKKAPVSTETTPSHAHDHADHDHDHAPHMNPDVRREVTVEVPADVVAKETEALVKKYQKLAKLPGFRAGKTPASIIRQRFAGDLKAEVVETLVPRYLRDELNAKDLTPISQPAVTDLKMDEGQPLRFTAAFEVMPEIKLGKYNDLAPEKKDASVSEDEVNQALEHLRESHATYTNVDEDRALKDGDFAQASFTGIPKDDAEGKEVKVDAVMVEIGGTNTLKEFSEHLRGAKVNEPRTFDVNYPAEAQDPRLAGKTLTYTVTVSGIKQKSVPDLNDDFAKEVDGGFESLAVLRTRIRENMEAERRHHIEHEAKDKLVEELVKRHDFPVPESLINSQIDTRLERGLRALAAQGMRSEDMRKMDFARLRGGQRDSAIREVKASLLLEAIAKKENIDVSDEEVDREIEQIAAQMQQTAAELRARMTREGAIERIQERMRNERALEFLYSGKK